MDGAVVKGIRRRERLTAKSDFDRLFTAGASVRDSLVGLRAEFNGLAYTRFAPVAGRRLGPAPLRNRIKRLLREAYRIARPGIPAGLDLAVMVQAPSAAKGGAAQLLRLSESLGRLAREAETKCRERRGNGED